MFQSKYDVYQTQPLPSISEKRPSRRCVRNASTGCPPRLVCVTEARTRVQCLGRVLLYVTYGDTFPFPDPAAPPKKPPRPGAPGHLGSLASLSSPGDSYNEGVKVSVRASRSGSVTCDTKQSQCRGRDEQSGTAMGPRGPSGVALNPSRRREQA